MDQRGFKVQATDTSLMKALQQSRTGATDQKYGRDLYSARKNPTPTDVLKAILRSTDADPDQVFINHHGVEVKATREAIVKDLQFRTNSPMPRLQNQSEIQNELKREEQVKRSRPVTSNLPKIRKTPPKVVTPISQPNMLRRSVNAVTSLFSRSEEHLLREAREAEEKANIAERNATRT